MTVTISRAPVGTTRLLELLPSPSAAVDLRTHRARYGELPLRGYGGPRGPQPLADTVAKADLRGRGGAGFPLAVKMRAVAQRPGGRATVVANGAESEPLSRKDALLLTCLPHLVLDGAVLAADAVGADVIHLVVPDGAPYHAAAAALAQRRDPVAVELHRAPPGYVASQDTALARWLGGGPALPTFTPPLPVHSGVRGRPTLASNVETLAHLALVARYGAAWYREVGSGSTAGTLLVTVDGAVGRPGVLEVPFGAPVADVLAAAQPDPDARALLIGGWFGGWVPTPRAATLTLDPQVLRDAGTGLGAGVLYLLAPTQCGVSYTAATTSWLAGQNAGQCGPCVNGLPAIAEALQALADGRAGSGVLERLERWCGLVTGRGACRHPDGVARFVSTALATFADEVAHHGRGRCSVTQGRRR